MSIGIPFEQLIKNGNKTPLEPLNKRLPDWALPTDREENYHHGIRRLIETSDFPGVSVYGPEAKVGDMNIDLLLEVYAQDKRSGVTIEYFEEIGIEVKKSVNAFESSSSNLDQVIKQAKLSHLDRLFVCVPDSNDRVRLDIDPEIASLSNQLDFSTNMISLRGIGGTIETRNGNRISYPAYYAKFRDNKSKLLSELKKNGHLETAIKNIDGNNPGNIDSPDHSKYGVWRDPILQKVGILRYDTRSGSVRVEKPAESLQPKRQDTERSVSESDVVHALWSYFVSSGIPVSVEAELPSQTVRSSPDMLDSFFGKRERVSIPRIDVIAKIDGQICGIEVKGPNPNWKRLRKQLSKYKYAVGDSQSYELDQLGIAIPEQEINRLKIEIEDTLPDVWVFTCENPRRDSNINRIR